MRPRLFPKDVKPAQALLGAVAGGVRERAQRTLETHRVGDDGRCTFCGRVAPCDAVKLAESILEVK